LGGQPLVAGLVVLGPCPSVVSGFVRAEKPLTHRRPEERVLFKRPLERGRTVWNLVKVGIIGRKIKGIRLVIEFLLESTKKNGSSEKCLPGRRC
jgi:hypothetical protein